MKHSHRSQPDGTTSSMVGSMESRYLRVVLRPEDVEGVSGV